MTATIDIPVPDLTGRRALVTGASDGVGLEIALRLARAGADLVLPVRNHVKGEAAAERIRAVVPGARVTLGTLDLASLASVAAYTDALRAEGRALHVLINNAGLMTPPTRRLSADGFELQFATNHLGHVALIAGLLPLLAAGSANIASMVSVAAARGSVHWDDLTWERSYDPMGAYRSSKIAFGLFARELDRRSTAGGWGLRSTLAHPGIAPTNLLAAQPELGRAEDSRGVRVIRALSRRGILFGTAASAALSPVYAATSPDAIGGELYGPGGLQHVSGPPAHQRMYAPLRDADEARRVWDRSAELAGVALGLPETR